MSNVYLGLLFLHGHITHPETFADTLESGDSREATASTSSRALERSPAAGKRGDTVGNACVAC